MSHGHAPPPTEFQLPNAPADGISSLTFSPTQPDRLLVTSWDKTIRLYDVSQPVLLGQYETAAAVLDACFAGTSPKRIYSGGLDPVVRGWDIETRTQVSLGTHEAPVKCVKFADAHGVVVTGSWDKTVGLWDPRASAATAVARIGLESTDAEILAAWAQGDASSASANGPDQLQVGRYMQPERVFSLDVVDHTIVVAMAGRHVFLYDIRNMKETLQRRESSLKYMTRAVRCMPDGRGYVTSSIEGRVAVEFFDPAPAAQAHKYAFKCHRQVVQGVDVVYPVNALAFHPTQGTFASGGSDGIVNIWDGFNKKRLRQYPKYPASISALAFNCTGNWLAIASSYTYDEGEKEHPADAIFIRPISESEVRPKLPHPKA
ncbi:mitotic spindle checkpoint protein Bub3 [Dimargaris cristalligena]|nr:mitotic spindle checkpoint protein Bub3 [Dimargaris cristalligena]